MTSLEPLVARCAGVVTRRQLDEIGVGETEIRTLLRHGTLPRLGRAGRSGTFTEPRPRSTTCRQRFVMRRGASTTKGFVVCDSALSSGLVTIDELRTSLATAPQHIHASLDRCDGKAQSGTGNMVRLRLTYRQVVHDWAACETTVIDLVRRRRHLWRHHNRR